MRKTWWALSCLVVCVLAIPGCYESLTNIATPDKVVFYDDLVGKYQAVDLGIGRLTSEKGVGKGKDKTYGYKQYDEKDALANKGTLWIIKLDNEHFYQVSVDGYETLDGKPVYAIGRLRIEGKPGAKTLTGFAFKSDEAFFGDSLVKTVEYEHVDGGEKTKHRALSMPPEKLQAYLALRAAEMTEPVLKYKQTGPAR